MSLAGLLAAGLAPAQSPPPTEYQVKAAVLWNFAKFIEWPASAFTNDSAPFVIGVLEPSPFQSELADTVREKQIGSHPVTVRTFRTAAEARQCHILFISEGATKRSRLADIFKTLGDVPVLTVGESKFIETGGMVRFVFEGNKIRFQIYAAAAQTAGLKISSKLLNLAVPVR